MTDLTWDDLAAHYDATVFSTGSPNDRRLEIPGEDLPGSYPAADLVAWYSGHPDYAPSFPVTARHAAVIGAGNVALDVARVLLKGSAGLAHTDVPDQVLDELDACPLTDVHIVARRGPAQIKFTHVELREMGELDGVDVVVDPAELAFDEASEEADAADRKLRTMVDLFRQWADRTPTGAPRRVHFRFLRRPVEIVGTDDVEALRVERSELDGGGGVVPTGEIETIPAQLVIRSVGYRGLALKDLPFDERRAVIDNEDGRVRDGAGIRLPGAYCAGWIKRGPTGVIGTNKSDAAETVRSLLADADAGALSTPGDTRPEAVLRLLEQRSVPVVSWDEWLRIDAYETQLGQARGRERAKVADLDAMLAARNSESASPDQ